MKGKEVTQKEIEQSPINTKFIIVHTKTKEEEICFLDFSWLYFTLRNKYGMYFLLKENMENGKMKVYEYLEDNINYSKKYEGWELVKVLKEGKFKEGTKFKNEHGWTYEVYSNLNELGLKIGDE